VLTRCASNGSCWTTTGLCSRTEADGHELLAALEPIDAWAKRWAKRIG
jgi:hypothetical protein